MFDRPTRLFLRWRDRGDPRALGELFDRTAPDLLRLGLHLVGNVGDAEDLLQSTFLAAIESAPRFAKGSRVEPWLAGILTNRAHAERRRQQRAPVSGADGDQRAAFDGEPDAHAARSELGAAARAALDALREPFRQPTVLRYLHGLEPAEIALLLNRSPGTVRAQIHRGIEQARRGLPAGLAAFAAVAGSAGRGLAAVRHVVLEAGASASAASGVTMATSAITVGVLMGKKGLVVLALAIALGVGGAAWWLGEDRSPPPALAADAPTVAAAEPTHSGVADTAASTVGESQPQRTSAAAGDEAKPEPGRALHAKVIDGPTKQPIVGALVELFGPRTMTLLELQRELADIARPGPLGVPQVWSGACSLSEHVPLDVRLEGAAHPFLVPPESGRKPLAETRTADDGTFALAMPASGGVIAITANGRATRHVAFAKAPDKEGSTIDVWPTTRFTGHVRTERDEVPPTPITLLFHCNEGSWSVTTDASGAFAIDAAMDYAMVESRTPGWTVTGERVLADGRRWHDDTAVRANRENTIWVKRFGAVRLHVTDAETGRAIETIDLRTFDQHRNPRHCGRFFAKDGWMALDPFGAEQFLNSMPATRDAVPNRMSLTVWADGYLPFSAPETSLFADEPQVIEAKLERGALPALAGTVQRNGTAVREARVQLRPFSQLNWQHDTNFALASQRTDAHGAFRVCVPNGEYLCEVFVANECEAQFAVSLPREQPLTIDLASQVYVEVVVIDAKGERRPKHNVAVNGRGHQQRQAKTSTDGTVIVGPFTPGKLSATAPLTATDWSWTGTVTENVDAAPGSRPHVTLRLPDDTPIRVSLAFEGDAPSDGFRGFVAHDSRVGAKDTEAVVETNGMVQLDVLPGESTLRIDAPNGRRWQLEIPTGTRDGAVLTLRWSGLAYAGVVTKENGKPLANARVFAAPRGSRDVHSGTSAKTGDDGSFRIDGLDPCEHLLSFDADRSSPYRERTGNPYSMQFFKPSALPAAEPTPMHIQMVAFRDGTFVGRDETTVIGRVLDDSGHAIPGALIGLRTIEPQEGGVLELFPSSGWQTCDSGGAFRIRVAHGAKHCVSLSRQSGDEPRLEDVVLANGSEVVRDFVLR